MEDLTSQIVHIPTHRILRIEYEGQSQKNDDLVITREAPMGEVCVIPNGLECCLGQRMVLLRPNPNLIDSKYLLYAVQGESVQLQIRWNEGTGSTVSNLRIPVLEALRIPFHTLPEQKLIAHILGSLDEKIENNRRMNETLEAMARALYKDWFVDFGPVRAKMEGREPPGLSAEVAELFPDSMGADDVPTGWAMKTLGDVISLNPTEKMSKETISPYLEMSALSTTHSWPDDLPVPRHFGSGMRFRNGDTLLARITPCLENGKTALIQCLGENEVGWGSTEFIVMRPKGDVPPEYCYVLARSEAFRDHAIQSMTGTSGRQRVQADSISGFKVFVPDRAIWMAFGDFCLPLFNRIKVNSLQSISLSGIRNNLLPKLLSGKISVHDVERMIA